ncbi:protease [Planctomyces bekefii]|uniref:Protease n=1 Tax=Planctomyces bekefii TaxID=1653850 RepID=A0A5C6M0A3_9PLAN|nr:protease [Planctomyces bekefii]
MIYAAVQPEVTDPKAFAGKKVAILAAHGVQESELIFPYEFLKARGAQVDIVAPSWSEGRVLVVQYVRPTLWAQANETFTTAAAKTYDLIVLTGGAWNSTVVRNDGEAIKLIQAHARANRPVAAICSGTQILINADLTSGHRLTGTSTAKVDLVNAGATYLDQPVVVDDQIITSRSPEDLVPFVNAIAEALK